MELYILYDIDKDIVGIFTRDVIPELKNMGVNIKDLTTSKITVNTLFEKLHFKDIAKLDKSMKVFEVEFNEHSNKIYVIDFGQLDEVHKLLGLNEFRVISEQGSIDIRVFARTEKEAIKKATKLKEKNTYLHFIM